MPLTFVKYNSQDSSKSGDFAKRGKSDLYLQCKLVYLELEFMQTLLYGNLLINSFMSKELIVKIIKDKFETELTLENFSNFSLNEYQNFVIDLFDFIYKYRDMYDLNCYDFRECLNNIYKNIDTDDIKIENRFIFIVDELGMYYANEPYFWYSSFDVYKSKIILELNSGIY